MLVSIKASHLFFVESTKIISDHSIYNTFSFLNSLLYFLLSILPFCTYTEVKGLDNLVTGKASVMSLLVFSVFTIVVHHCTSPKTN